MKKIILLFCIAQSLVGLGQTRHYCSDYKIHSNVASKLQQNASVALWKTDHYDMKFVQLNINCERNTRYISGNVKSVSKVVVASMDTFFCLLHQNHTIDSVYINGVKNLNVSRKDSLIRVKLATPFLQNTTFTATVYYKGTAPTGGAAIGSGYSTGTSGSWGNQATWSLSESQVAYHWWPCKQNLRDKIDSSWVFITTDSLNLAGSNGRLTNVVVVGNKKRFEWKSRTPIAYYLISVAIAKYKQLNFYAKPLYMPNNDSILIQNFIYDNAINNTNWINNQKPSLLAIKPQLEFLSSLYGIYPFYKEKYGNCMAPFSGGMEHQTMTSQGFFDYYINGHELGHQWWGDNVTCKSWSDIFINEGFASYTEHLIAQYLDLPNFAPNLNSAHNAVMSQTGGSCYFTGNDTTNDARIFDSRLTYDKGGSIIHTMRWMVNNDSVWFNTLRSFQILYKDNVASVVDFKNHLQTQSSINFTPFFNEWYYGEGYPTYNVTWNFSGNTFYLKSSQTTSKPTITALFTTPMQYKLLRIGAADTLIRVPHNVAIENYSMNVTGTVTGVQIDPNNWVINKVVGPTKDVNLSIDEFSNSIVSTISILPNPTHDVVKIKFPNLFNGSVEVIDGTGKKCLTQNITKQDAIIDMKQLANGIYFFAILDEKNTLLQTYKIVKE
jgi:aminopeptidase N